MFIGHYAVGFGLKRMAPKLSLGTLVLGATLLDILFGIFVLTNVGHAGLCPAPLRRRRLNFTTIP
jgi:hypothetical protein